MSLFDWVKKCEDIDYVRFIKNVEVWRDVHAILSLY